MHNQALNKSQNLNVNVIWKNGKQRNGASRAWYLLEFGIFLGFGTYWGLGFTLILVVLVGIGTFHQQFISIQSFWK